MGEWHDVLLQQTERLSISELREGYREVGRDLLRLLYFVEMNAVGLRKILKKIVKRFGYKFTDYYVKTRANHPYSQLRQVFKHVVIWPTHYTTFSFQLELNLLPWLPLLSTF